jgi:hypothetical protein
MFLLSTYGFLTPAHPSIIFPGNVIYLNDDFFTVTRSDIWHQFSLIRLPATSLPKIFPPSYRRFSLIPIVKWATDSESYIHAYKEPCFFLLFNYNPAHVMSLQGRHASEAGDVA